MYLRLRQLPLWLLMILWVAIISLAALVFMVPTKAADSTTVVPAPTLIWNNHQSPSSIQFFIDGLTKNNTMVAVTLNGQLLAGVKVRRGWKGVSSFNVPLPRDLPAGVYEVVATAKLGDVISQLSQPLELVVPGTVVIQNPFVYKA